MPCWRTWDRGALRHDDPGCGKTRSLGMAVIRRIYVEKKAGYDVEARALLLDLRDNLAVKGISGLRLLNRYDVSGVGAREIARARHAIFSEPPVDELYNEDFPLAAGETAFAIEYLPGQYDQRADSARSEEHT